MSLAKKYSKEVKQILSKYPPENKRSAVMPLLYLAQREDGYVNKPAMQDIANLLDMTETEVAAIVGFYTLYHDEKAGKYRMQVCTDLPCALRGAERITTPGGRALKFYSSVRLDIRRIESLKDGAEIGRASCRERVSSPV